MSAEAIELALRVAFGDSGERAARAGLPDDGNAELRAAWRALALAWYRRELARALRTADAGEARRLRARLVRCSDSPTLRPYRDGSACMPLDEHRAWQAWMDAVDALRE